MTVKTDYEVVIGLEVHVQLNTPTKIFCGCPTTFNAPANLNTCPVCAGFPGALPVFNKDVLTSAIKAGLALNCSIADTTIFARKNYFYPDLPKGYQISQSDDPICIGGHLDVEQDDGSYKRVRITRIHMEEDAGKSVHGGSTSIGVTDGSWSFMDYNRSSMPLLEIVSEPDMRSSEEARLFLQQLRTELIYTGVSDLNMEEGSLRCDANISIMPKGAKEFGTRAEVKNLNSFRNIQKAINYEVERQINIVENGGEVDQETRLYDADKGVTFTMRSKEEALDYRYFADPDLTPIAVPKDYVDAIRKNMPESARTKRDRFVNDYAINMDDANILVSEKHYADYFEALVELVESPKIAANWILSEILRLFKDSSGETVFDLGISPQQLGQVIELIGKGTISNNIGKQVLGLIISEGATGADVAEIVEKHNLAQVSDSSEVESVVQSVFDANPSEFERFKGGDKKLMGFFMGEVMKATKGRANPKVLSGVINSLANKK